MIVCFYVKTFLLESYFRLKNCIDKISDYFKKKECNCDFEDQNQFGNIRYNPFKNNDENKNYEYVSLKNIVIEQPKPKPSANLIENWDIISDESQ